MQEIGKRVKFAVCGTAAWARNVHIPALKAHPDVELAGIWGRDPGRTTLLAEEMDLRCFRSFDELVDAVEAVSFVVPPAVQAELAAKAAARGRHVLLEKPLAPDLSSARRLVRAIDDAGVLALCFLTRLHVPRVRSLVEEARGLNPAVGRAFFYSNALIEGPYAGSAWRQEGDGALQDAGPHGLSVLASVLGPVREVGARRAEGGGYLLSLRHREGEATLDLDLRDAATTLSERYAFEGGTRTAELAEFSYDRKDSFAMAVDLLLAARSEPEASAWTRLGLPLHLVAVIQAAERSLRNGGMPEAVEATYDWNGGTERMLLATRPMEGTT